MCGSREHPSPPQEELLEIPKGGGVSKAAFFKVSMKQNWSFQREGKRGEFKSNNLSGMGIFWNNTIKKFTTVSYNRCI